MFDEAPPSIRIAEWLVFPFRNPALVVLIPIVIIMFVNRSQEILEDPICDLSSLSSTNFIREAEMYSFVYSGVDDILRRIRETIVSASVDNRGTRVCGGYIRTSGDQFQRRARAFVLLRR